MKLSKLVSLLTAFSLFFAISTPVRAAEFVSGRDVQVVEETSNLYAAGRNVAIFSPVQKDLIVGGSNVTIKAEVERSLFAAGGEVVINPPFVGGSVRAAGANVTLTGTFNEDVILAGENVVIKNATITGDVVVMANKVTIVGSKVGGRFMGNYGELEGDLKSQVTGSIVAEKYEAEPEEQDTLWDRINPPFQISIILTLLIVGYFLHKRRRLEIPSIKFDAKFSTDLFVGLVLLIVPIIAMVISFLTLTFPVVLPLVIDVYIKIFLTMFIFPIYLANFIKNQFKMKTDIRWLIVASYIGGLLVNLLDFALLNIIQFFFIMALVGFLLRTGMQMVNMYLHPRHAKKS